MEKRLGVVVGIDGSTESRVALRFALDEGVRRATGVRVVSVVLPPQYWPEAYGLSAPPTIADVKADLRAIAHRMAADVVAEEPRLASVAVELHEMEGRPAAVLVEQSRGADLLVVGHRGRGSFASAMLGSVGLQCVLHAECPVVIVRPPAQAVKGDEETEATHAPGHIGFGGAVIGPLY
jgi:nucleotide-binding universal stress UspA family protein